MVLFTFLKRRQSGEAQGGPHFSIKKRKNLPMLLANFIAEITVIIICKVSMSLFAGV